MNLDGFRPTTVVTSEDYFLTLCETIFSAKDFSFVENTIAKAAKIRLGLRALNLADVFPNPLYTYLTKQQEDIILIGLNRLSQVYEQQTVQPIILQ